MGPYEPGFCSWQESARCKAPVVKLYNPPLAENRRRIEKAMCELKPLFEGKI